MNTEGLFFNRFRVRSGDGESRTRVQNSTRKLSTCLFAVFDLNQKVGTTKDTFSDPALNLIFLYEPQRKTSPIFWMIH